MLCNVWFAYSRPSNYAKNHFFHGFIMFFDCKSSTLERCPFWQNILGVQIRFWTTFILVKNSRTVSRLTISSLALIAKKPSFKWINSLNPIISIIFKGSAIEVCTSVRYLGYIIQSDKKWNKDSLTDEDEIFKRSGELYKRAYMIRSKFSKCSIAMKKYLFTTYLSSIYCSSLWNLCKSQYQKIRVSYNNAFRIVFGLSRDSSATLMFIDYNIRNFYDIRKVAVRSLAIRNLHSKNCIIDFVSDSSIHYDSELSKIWRNILQTNWL